jgi:hypothetical protein
MRPLFRPVLAALPAIRTTIILVLPCVIGAAAGALTYVTCHSVPQALLASGSAAGSSAQLLDQMMGSTSERRSSGQDNNRDDNRSDDIRQAKA